MPLQSAYVSEEDFAEVSKYIWWAHKNGNTVYACRTTPEGQQYMHTFIMGRSWIDHIDHDGLNNRRSNLRPTDRVRNGQNRRPNKNSASQYKGVFRGNGKWMASINVNKKKVHLGTFADELDAARAYDAAAHLHFGEYAEVNF